MSTPLALPNTVLAAILSELDPFDMEHASSTCHMLRAVLSDAAHACAQRLELQLDARREGETWAQLLCAAQELAARRRPATIAVARSHALHVRQRNMVFSWGGSNYECMPKDQGHLGQGDLTDAGMIYAPRRVLVPDGVCVREVGCMACASVFLDTTGRLWSCGSKLTAPLSWESCLTEEERLTDDCVNTVIPRAVQL